MLCVIFQRNKEGTIMAKIWRNRLEAGTQVWADCPEKYRDEVKRLLKLDVVIGKITPERYEEIVGEPYS